MFYQCSGCEGRALSIPQIRRIAGDPFAVKLMRLVKLSRHAGERLCPFCHRRMMVIQIQEPRAALDGCEPCKMIWFDAPTYETVPEGAVETMNTLPALLTEQLAMERLKEFNARQEAAKKKSKKKSVRDSLRTLLDGTEEHENPPR